MSFSLFRELARGGGGAPAIRLLSSARRSRTLLMVSLLARQAPPEVLVAYDALKAVSAAAPKAADLVLAHPMTGVAVSRASRATHAASPGLFTGMALATALRAGVDLHVEAPCEELFLPTVGRVRGGAVFSVLNGQLFVDGVPHAPVSPVRLALGPREVELDTDVDVARWQEVMAAGWDELALNHPEVAEECALAVTVLSPIPTPPSGMASATLADAFGCVYLSLPPDPRTAALTLVHELQHAKLAVLIDLFPLTEAHPGELFYAPWRDDPRPLVGLLHGTYAHLGVAAFWRRYTDGRAQEEHTRWRTASRQAAATMLASGRLTRLGTAFVTEIAEVLDGWDGPVSPGARTAAETALARHRALWEDANRQRLP
ncbi:HEXXH motif-containing putative peptide modification protein [Lentzea sp. BCCO 10_0061]|uniref:HEXXH motif-containing putative peptide modification protein n=1 Tax=Lentzea sokolovensis TaxID=3095429 RepID=A0ABU4V6D0_9PSEU|nr:HEXXH motif-containing putative peptide modification protein [Lentzea sp. BCCO 10_0061]MDX8147355.1 HEXXH motif-containing putative peptide modification protein [Lentzea sp. BCCO 10_0061]